MNKDFVGKKQSCTGSRRVSERETRNQGFTTSFPDANQAAVLILTQTTQRGLVNEVVLFVHRLMSLDQSLGTVKTICPDDLTC